MGLFGLWHALGSCRFFVVVCWVTVQHKAKRSKEEEGLNEPTHYRHKIRGWYGRQDFLGFISSNPSDTFHQGSPEGSESCPDI